MRGLPVASFSAAVEGELLIAARWEITDFNHRVSERPNPSREGFNFTGEGTEDRKEVQLHSNTAFYRTV